MPTILGDNLIHPPRFEVNNYAFLAATEISAARGCDGEATSSSPSNINSLKRKIASTAAELLLKNQE